VVTADPCGHETAMNAVWRPQNSRAAPPPARRYRAPNGAEDGDLLLLGYGFTLSFIEAVRRAGPSL
jgi:hypothetical protein